MKIHTDRISGLAVLIVTLSSGCTIGNFTINVTNAHMGIKMGTPGKNNR